MNRIAHERFAETRTAAHLPANAPRFRWAVLTPALSLALILVVAVSVVYNSPSGVDGSGNPIATVTQGDDDYLTVQPTNNPNMNASIRRDWSLRQTLAQSERMNRLSNGLKTNSGFSNVSATSAGASGMMTFPRGVVLYQGRPVIRVYQLPNGRSVQEVDREF